MNVKNNRKALYTKNILADTLFSLMKQSSYAEITILQICQYAGVARSSFYRNFQTKEDVVDYLIKRIIDQKYPDPKDERRMFFHSDYSQEVWFTEKELFEQLYKNNIFELFTRRLNQTIEEAMKLQNIEEDPYYEYMATEMAYITSSVYYTWTKRGFTEDRKTMDQLLNRLHSSRVQRSLLAENKN